MIDSERVVSKEKGKLVVQTEKKIIKIFKLKFVVNAQMTSL